MKARYFAEPVYKRANEKGHIELVEDFGFEIDGVPYWIPAGYVCDGASIPRPFWSIIGSPFDPEKVASAFAHDTIYLTHCRTRSDADEVLFQFLLQSGSRLRTARTMWFSVRGFAGFAWKNTAADKSELAKIRLLIEIHLDRAKFNSVWFTQSA